MRFSLKVLPLNPPKEYSVLKIGIFKLQIKFESWFQFRFDFDY